MGIKLSKNENNENNDFDGKSGDYDLDASTYNLSVGPEWIIDMNGINKINESLKELDNIPEKLKLFSLEDDIVGAKCMKVYDGDTCHLGFKLDGEWVKLRCRMIGYNSAEMRGEEREQGILDRDFLASLIFDKKLIAHFGKFDKYGRPLVKLYLIDELTKTSEFNCDVCVNDIMMKNNHGVPYNP